MSISLQMTQLLHIGNTLNSDAAVRSDNVASGLFIRFINIKKIIRFLTVQNKIGMI